MTTTPFLLACLAAFASAGGVCAEDKPAPPVSDADARICETYGPGYQLVPGTSVCIKVSGYLDATVTFDGSPSTGPAGSPGK